MILTFIVTAGETVPGKLHMATAGCPERSPQYPNGRWQPLVVLPDK